MAKWKGRKAYLHLLVREDGRCHYCRLRVWVREKNDAHHPRMATLDHKTPRAHGGGSEDENIVLACARCNSEKGDIPYEMYRWYRHMVLRGHNRRELLDAIGDVCAEQGYQELSPSVGAGSELPS